MIVGGGVATALAASPDPTLRPGGDTRTTGTSPGFVGSPLLAILGVLALGVGSVVATLAYIRASGGRTTPQGDRRRALNACRTRPDALAPAGESALVLSGSWKEMWGS